MLGPPHITTPSASPAFAPLWGLTLGLTSGMRAPPPLFFAASAVLFVLRYWLRCEQVERVFKSNVFGINAQENARQRAV
jgi:hypothetical protein